MKNEIAVLRYSLVDYLKSLNMKFSNFKNSYKTRFDLINEMHELEYIIDNAIIYLKVYNYYHQDNKVDFEDIYNEIMECKSHYMVEIPSYDSLQILSWDGQEKITYNKYGYFESCMNYVTGYFYCNDYDEHIYNDSYGFHKEWSAKLLKKEPKILNKEMIIKKVQERQYFLAEIIKILNKYLSHKVSPDEILTCKNTIIEKLNDLYYFNENKFLLEASNKEASLNLKKHK